MSDNHSAFVGSIPQNYDRYLGPIIFEDYANDLANRIAKIENTQILEVAAGTGILTQQLCDILPATSNIVVTDLNQDMLFYAQQKLTDKSNLTFHCTDAANIPFPDNSFDIVTVQFAIMFFPDKVAALKEWSRVLKPDGKVVLNIWDSIPENYLLIQP
jgi:ubiquinone/menaquinone biosynthesis C-methylase UbiE